MKTFTYKGCEVMPEQSEKSILLGCNNGVNRYLRRYWHVRFPDGTWVNVGTKDQVRAYIDRVGYRHGAGYEMG
jgi:hypothetical protein